MLNAIKKARLIEGITQLELARAMNVTPGAVSQWENGINMPSVSRLKELAAVLHTSVEKLLEKPEGKEVS